MAVSLAHIGRLGYELLDEESLTDLIIGHLDEAADVEEPGYAAFADEQSLWD